MMRSARLWWSVTTAIVTVATIVLLAMGRPAICPCGTVRLWHGMVQSSENSQQFADWYSLTHAVHGLIFCGLTWLVARRAPIAARVALAIAVEAGWEIIENTPMIIDRYRAVTLAWGYSGDSMLNSLGDIAFMSLGFALAVRLGLSRSVMLGIALETVALAVIRDNLMLNIVMLIAPIDAIRIWQAG